MEIRVSGAERANTTVTVEIGLKLGVYGWATSENVSVHFLDAVGKELDGGEPAGPPPAP